MVFGMTSMKNADQWSFEFIGLHAADEEGIAFPKSFHQQVR